MQKHSELLTAGIASNKGKALGATAEQATMATTAINTAATVAAKLSTLLSAAKLAVILATIGLARLLGLRAGPEDDGVSRRRGCSRWGDSNRRFTRHYRRGRNNDWIRIRFVNSHPHRRLRLNGVAVRSGEKGR